MAFAPIEQAIINTCFKNLRLIATDMDGTLTTQGKFTASLLHALEDLSAADIPVLIVTGRSAGWVSGLATYLPVIGAMCANAPRFANAENGGLFYPAQSDQPVMLTPIPDVACHQQQLAVAYQRLKSEFPHIHYASELMYKPAYVTTTAEGEGFCELARHLSKPVIAS